MKKFLISIITISFFYFNCGPSVYYVKPPDWENESQKDSTIKYYSQYLKDWKFFIDPGHGGNDRFNKGPEGDAIEADLNLRVSLNLKNYLEKAGAKVVLSRDKDTTVELIDRSKLANNSGCDIFISIHHNALGNDDHYTNYTSTWYHAYEGHKDYNPCNHDIAKYVQRDLAYVMGNSGSLASFDGTMSDFSVYPNSGFSVLRNTNIPAILIEGSFFSSYYEEQRLIIPEFNDIQAWGIFRGLGKYFKAGIPKLEMLTPDSFSTGNPIILIKASDNYGINQKTIYVDLDGKELPFKFDNKTGTITITPSENLTNGDHTLNVIVQNKNGNHSFPFRKRIRISRKAQSLKINIFPREIPADEKALSIISVKVIDSLGQNVADSTIVYFNINKGKIDDFAYTKNGIASAYIGAASEECKAVIEVTCQNVIDTDTIYYINSNSKYVSGLVTDQNLVPISGCGIIIPDVSGFIFPSLPYTLTDNNGKFIFNKINTDSFKLFFIKDGYFGKEVNLKLDSKVNQCSTKLDKVFNGVLFDKNIFIDARYGGIEKGEIYNNLTSSKINLDIAKYLYNLLKAAGANAILVRDSDNYISEEDRAKMTTDYKRGIYIRIDVSNKENISIVQYPNIPNTNLSRSVMNELHKITGLDTTKITSSYNSIFMLTSIGTISVSLPSLNSKFFNSENLKYRESQCAWGILNGILKFYGFDNGKTLTITLKEQDNKILKGTEAILDGSLISVSNNNGIINFYNITGGNGKIFPLDKE